jgi:hypothetical protein
LEIVVVGRCDSASRDDFGNYRIWVEPTPAVESKCPRRRTASVSQITAACYEDAIYEDAIYEDAMLKLR